ncbi:MAG: hypothetical protein ACJA1A_002571 [Saprospiraceae bacterium]|jgi:hypothetical protein|tara:strand:+ start:2293 stop:2673 length:381 start_codon:yes stop_codon:yes gene_type:complete
MIKVRKHMVQSYISAYNNFNIDGMEENLDAHILFENYTNGHLTHVANGMKEFRSMAVAGSEFFISRLQTVMCWEISENNIVVDIKCRGIAKVNLQNRINAGEKIEMDGKSAFTFHQNKIIKIVDKS